MLTKNWKTEQECIVNIIRRKHCRAVHKDFKDFLSSARLWSPKRGSAAVGQPRSRALPFVSFVPNSLPCHPGFHPCHPGFIWTACLAPQTPIFASLPPIQSSFLLQTPRRSCIHFQICLMWTKFCCLEVYLMRGSGLGWFRGAEMVESLSGHTS